jgi:hypothetical protein
LRVLEGFLGVRQPSGPLRRFGLQTVKKYVRQTSSSDSGVIVAGLL